MTAPAAVATPAQEQRSEPRRGILERHWGLALGLLGVLTFALGVAAMDSSPIGAAVDDAIYVILGRSIATGQGYRSLNLPGAPLNTHFPPGYPLVLAGLWRLAPSFPANLVLFKLFNVLCLAVAAVGTARFVASRGAGRQLALGIGIVTAVSVPLLVLGNLLLSEPFFIALLVFLLAAVERFASPLFPGERHSAWRAASLGVAIGLCILVRTHGIVLVPAVVLVLCAQRRWRDAAVIASSAVIVLLPWQLFSARHAGALPAPLLGGYDSYSAWWVRGLRLLGWQIIPRTLERTIPEAGGMFAVLFSPTRDSFGHGAAILALALLVAASVVAWWRRIPVTLLFLAGYLTIIAVWPFQPGRFIWGVWPLILIVITLGARATFVEGRRWKPAVRALMLASICWVGVGYTMYETRAIRGQWWSSIPRGAVEHIAFAVGWTRANTAANDIVATEDEGPVFLYTGRRTIPVRSFTVMQYLGETTPAADAAEGLIPLLDRFPARAVLVYTKVGHQVARYLSERPSPILAPRGEFPGGAAFTVFPR